MLPSGGRLVVADSPSGETELVVFAAKSVGYSDRDDSMLRLASELGGLLVRRDAREMRTRDILSRLKIAESLLTIGAPPLRPANLVQSLRAAFDEIPGIYQAVILDAYSFRIAPAISIFGGSAGIHEMGSDALSSAGLDRSALLREFRRAPDEGPVRNVTRDTNAIADGRSARWIWHAELGAAHGAYDVIAVGNGDSEHTLELESRIALLSEGLELLFSLTSFQDWMSEYGPAGIID